ncbi:MAG: DNA translocase FtsK [Acidobacteriota bacterium]|nr:DNA translocase FtsK [Acidobacteriota bacterium]
MQSSVTDSRPSNRQAKRRVIDGRRRFELAGFLLCVLGLLLLLCLATYHRTDPSFDTATAVGSARNWIGLTGSYSADVLLQIFGWCAFLLPFFCFLTGVRWLMVRPLESPGAKCIGAGLMIASLSALCELIPRTPLVYGFIRGGGLLGYLLAAGLVRTMNPGGATIVAAAVFFISLFLVTKFSFSWAGGVLRRAITAVFAPVARRWSTWREARERGRMEQRMARERSIGKEPIVTQRFAGRDKTAPRQKELQREVPQSASVDTDEHADAFTGGHLDPLPAEHASDAIDPRILEEERTRGKAAGIKVAPKRGTKYKLPSTSMLRPPEDQQGINEESLRDRALQLTSKLAEFGVMGTVTQIHPGPVVTTFEFKPEAGIKYSRITNLVDDLCLAMKAESILIERIAGKSTVGIEVPNLDREIIYLREILESHEFAVAQSRLTLCLGKDITGKVKVGDLGQMPHLLIAGSTGSGKSVAINSLILSILFKCTPDEVRLILIDPKRIELNLYDGIPHLFTPIVTEPKVAANVLRRATFEMEERLKKLAQQGVRNIEQYNKLFEPGANLSLFDNTEPKEEGPLPYLVIVIDELADLMMVEPQNVEESITRLAQMARAVGIHLILATQRPSVDVITGLIKANLPSRISFRVASKVDSRTILDSNGAEALLGRGDMLFMPPASSRLARLHGSFVLEKEINKVVDWWKSQSAPQYNEEFLKPLRDAESSGDDESEEDSPELDAVYEDAIRIVVESGKASTSLLQRRLRLGYGRAARLLDLMQKDGIISAPDGSRPREVLKRPDWLQEVDEPLR